MNLVNRLFFRGKQEEVLPINGAIECKEKILKIFNIILKEWEEIKVRFSTPSWIIIRTNNNLVFCRRLDCDKKDNWVMWLHLDDPCFLIRVLTTQNLNADIQDWELTFYYNNIIYSFSVRVIRILNNPKLLCFDFPEKVVINPNKRSSERLEKAVLPEICHQQIKVSIKLNSSADPILDLTWLDLSARWLKIKCNK